MEIKGIRPPVWRRLLAPDGIMLSDLHQAIQDAFGWQGYHLHEFIIRGARYGDPANDEYGEMDLRDEAAARLRTLDLKEGERFGYIYDFGDGWQHTLRVEKILSREEQARSPSCIGGGRACPPEDVGGVGGYSEFLESLADPASPQHTENLRWIGGAFDPEAFDLQAANKRVRRGILRKRAAGWAVPEDGGGEAADPVPAAPRPEAQPATGHEPAAQNLPLRRDVETFLAYVRDLKVTGTQSTGNLPLKTVAELSVRMVRTSVLEQEIGGHVYRFRSEEEVWPVYFVHVLANGAGLVAGGPGRRWRLTTQGASFSSIPAVEQVLALLRAWWYRVNWLIAVPFDIFGEDLSPEFHRVALSIFRQIPVGKAVEPGPFVARLIKETGLTWKGPDDGRVRSLIGSAVERMVIRPLEDFGAMTTESAKETNGPTGLEWTKLVSFSLTDFGHGLLKILDAKAAQNKPRHES